VLTSRCCRRPPGDGYGRRCARTFRIGGADSAGTGGDTGRTGRAGARTSTALPHAGSEQRAIDTLTRKILLVEIELQRFNLDYQQNVAKQGRWKGWRYATIGETNTGLGLAGGLITTHNRGSKLHRPSTVNIKVQEQANIIPMIRAIIGAGGAAMEFGINGWHDTEGDAKVFRPGRPGRECKL
jgi:hypothetical protein